MNIDRIEFISWMERIMDRFDMLKDSLTDIEKKKNTIDGEVLLDNQDLLQMLKISSRSLQRYRSSGKLPYYTISGKLYYKLTFKKRTQNYFKKSFFSPSAPIIKYWLHSISKACGVYML